MSSSCVESSVTIIRATVQCNPCAIFLCRYLWCVARCLLCFFWRRWWWWRWCFLLQYLIFHYITFCLPCLSALHKYLIWFLNLPARWVKAATNKNNATFSLAKHLGVVHIEPTVQTKEMATNSMKFRRRVTERAKNARWFTKINDDQCHLYGKQCRTLSEHSSKKTIRKTDRVDRWGRKVLSWSKRASNKQAKKKDTCHGICNENP